MKTVSVLTQLPEADHRFLKMKAVEMGMTLSSLTQKIIQLFILQEKAAPLILNDLIERFNEAEQEEKEMKQTA